MVYGRFALTVVGLSARVRVEPHHLSSQTIAWLAEYPHARRVVRSVWGKLTELERAGQHPGAIAALRRVLTDHQPTPAGRCRTCQRRAWRRRRFPCIVWHQVRGELLGLFASGDHHQPAQWSTSVCQSGMACAGVDHPDAVLPHRPEHDRPPVER